MEKAKSRPTVIVFDLNFEAVEPLKLISQLEGQSGDPRRQPASAIFRTFRAS